MQLLPSIITVILFLLACGVESEGADRSPDLRAPTLVIQGYVRATYARDYIDAYRYISAADQRVKDVNRYAQQRGAFVGQALQVTRKLASFIEIKSTQKKVEHDRIQAVVKVNIPEPNKLASLLLNWDIRRLNSLEIQHFSQIIEALDEKKRNGSLEMIEIEQNVELVKEGDQWRVFLNWAAGVNIPLRLSLVDAPDVDAALSKKEVVAQPGDLFELFLKVKNRSKQPLIVRIGHVIEPRNLAHSLDFVECGFLLPFTLPAGKEEEFFARYLLRENLPEGVQQLNLTYEFRLLK